MTNTNKSPLSIKLVAVGLFAIFFLILKFGEIEKADQAMLIMGLGILIFILIFVFIVIIPTIKAKKAIQQFALRHSISIQKKVPPEIILPDIFLRVIPQSNDTINNIIQEKAKKMFNISIVSGSWENVKILSRVRNFIKVNPNFFIFTNSQNIHTSHGKNEIQKHLCFLFSISPVVGYHKIAYAENKMFQELTNMVKNTIAKNYQTPNNQNILTHDPKIDEQFSFLSSNETELKEILPKISSTLLKIDETLSPLRLPQSGIDNKHCTMTIDITGKYALVRFEYLYATEIEQIFILMNTLQKSLSPNY